MGKKVTYVDSLKGFSHFKVSVSWNISSPFLCSFLCARKLTPRRVFLIPMSVKFWINVINKECWQNFDESWSFLWLLMPGFLTIQFHVPHVFLSTRMERHFFFFFWKSFVLHWSLDWIKSSQNSQVEGVPPVWMNEMVFGDEPLRGDSV